MSAQYVQYGCGYVAPEGWANFDSSPTLRLERLPLLGNHINVNATRFPANVLVGDIVSGRPIETGTVSGVYASHVLEHLSLEDLGIALLETFRILSPDGYFRLVVPDLAGRARHYLTAYDAGRADACSEFMRLTCLGKSSIPTTLFGKVRFAFANSHHRWMWDYQGLAQALTTSGFDRIRRASFNDSVEPAFCAVEDRSRFFWSPEGRPDLELPECVIEARRPSVSS